MKIAMLLFMLPCLVTAGQLYKWVDEQGVVHYSDRLPAASYKHERSVLNSQGQEIDRLSAAKSKEQLRKQRLDESLKKRQTLEQQKIIEKQQIRDKMLLATYSSTAEMEQARDAKLAMLGNLIALTEQRVLKLDDALLDLEKSTAPESGDEREAIQQRLERYRELIRLKREEQHKISNQFDEDIQRFIVLLRAKR